MFRGVSPLSLDAKGRIAIPARYRERLRNACAGQLVVTIDHLDRCLLIYPLPSWETVEEKLTQLSSTSRPARALKRLLMGHAEECEMDGAGRILLSGPQREYARLDRRAVLVGQGNKFELWDEDAWAQQRESWLDEGAAGLDLPAGLDTLAL